MTSNLYDNIFRFYQVYLIFIFNLNKENNYIIYNK